MGEEEQKLVFTVTVDNQTGAAQGISDNFQKMGDSAQAAGTQGRDAMGLIEGRLVRIGVNLALVQLALNGFRDAVKDSAAFQDLQQTFSETAKGLVENLEPALEIVSRGLQGLVIIVGGVLSFLEPVLQGFIKSVGASADMINEIIAGVILLVQGNVRGAAAEFKEASQDWSKQFTAFVDQDWTTAINKAEKALNDGFARMSGDTKAFHAKNTDELQQALNDQIKVNDERLKADQVYLKEQISSTQTSYNDKMQFIKAQETLETSTLLANENIKLQILQAKAESGKMSLKQYAEERTTLVEETAAKEQAIEEKAAAEKKRIDDASQKQLEAMLQKNEQAFASAAAKSIEANNSLGSAIAAGSAATVTALAGEAAKQIEIQGAVAAAAAFKQAALVGGLPAGLVAGAATLAWYTALATTVEVGGSKLSSAISGSSGGGSTGASSSSSSSSAPVVKAAATSSQVSPTIVAAAAPGGMLQLTLNVNLAGEPILKLVQQATFNGSLQINANAIVNG